MPSCDLQLRSYSVRNLQFFCDFALRAAYYLGLPAFGPVPLPRQVQRWTVIKSTFVFKKSQENFERITMRRLIQIRDGHPETVQLWLAFLQKHAYYGIGMKANVWEFSKLGMSFCVFAPPRDDHTYSLPSGWLTGFYRRRKGDGRQPRADGEAAGGQVGAPGLRRAEADKEGTSRAAAGARGPGGVPGLGAEENCRRPIGEIAMCLLNVSVVQALEARVRCAGLSCMAMYK